MHILWSAVAVDFEERLARSPRRGSKRVVLRRIGSGLLVVLLVAWLAALFIPSRRWVSFHPGSAVGVKLNVKGAKRYPSTGKVLLATVGIEQKHTLIDAIWAWWDDDVDVFPRERYFPHQTEAQTRAAARVDMVDSQLAATVVAMRHLGYEPESGGIGVGEVGKGLPVAKVLKPGDVVTEVDGARVCTLQDVRRALEKRQAGDAIDVAYQRGRKPAVHASVKLVKAKGVARPLLGISPAGSNCRFAVEVTLDTGQIGGPSAGLAMTLAILDALTPGNLMGKNVVATTGTIELDEAIGLIGGVHQKTVAVKAAGAKLFLVPAAESAQAKTRAGDMKVVPIKTLDDALAALRQAGGDPLPPPRNATSPGAST